MVILGKLIGYIVFVNKLSHFYIVVVSVVCITAAALISMMTYQITAKADSVSWVAGGDVSLISNDERAMNLHPQHCREQKVLMDDRLGLNYFEQSGFTNACVYDMGAWRYALTNRTYKGTFYNHNDVSFALSIEMDTKMYRVENLHALDIPVYTPYSKGLVYANGGVGWGRKLTVYKDIIKRLTKVDNDSYVVKDVDSPDFTFKRPNGNLLPVGKAVSSDNGRWLVFEAIDLGIMRLDLETYEIKRVSSIAPRYGMGATPHMSLAISDDGRTLVMAGENTPFKIYQVTAECGDATITDELTKDTPIARPCLDRDIGQYLETVLPSGLAVANSIRLSADTGEVGFIARLNSDRFGQNTKEYVVQAPGYVPTSRLDYLAMGDSFSSGEGDTQVLRGKKFYLSGTDVEGDEKTPKEKCHISSRSYPFLLRNAMNIADDDMKSVACSGAELAHDYVINDANDTYNGQGNRLAVLNVNINQFQAQAINMFTPGRVKQLEFIEKHKPRSITLTGSGNDVGFGDVVSGCIMSNFYPCVYETTDSGRALIGQGIANQHYELTKLFAKIHDISPATKVYMVGYPQFVEDTSFFCAPNVPLSQAERVMISESVKYLNRVIKSAAESSGVEYVDIENSLDGHKLCESGTSYVTGLALARTLGLGSSLIGKSETQESFHPNKSGHKLMADAIRKELGYQSLLNYADYPVNSNYQQLVKPVDPSEYFADSMKNTNKQYRKANVMLSEYIQKVPILNMINIRFGNFKPHALVQVEIHSEPVDLGSYAADESGSLSVDIALPSSVPAGYHTLHLIGLSYSGEEIDVWQSIEVRGSEGDIDEDGISDDTDQCSYVTESRIDGDKDGIDDACDLLIEFLDNEDIGGSVSTTVSDRRKKSVKLNNESLNQLPDGVSNVRVSTERLLYLNGQNTIAPESDRVNENKSFQSNDKGGVAGVILLGSAGSLIFILYCLITRYSNHKDT